MKKLLFSRRQSIWPVVDGDIRAMILHSNPEMPTFFQHEAVLGIFGSMIGLMLRITAKSERKLMSELTDEEARACGYQDAEDTLNQLRHDLYPNLEKKDEIVIVKFKVYDVDGEPVLRNYAL